MPTAALIPVKSPKNYANSTLKDVLSYFFDAGIVFTTKDGKLAVQDPRKAMTDWLREMTAFHKDALIRLADLRLMMAKIEQEAIDLRYHDHLGDLSREASVERLWRKIKWFAKQCDTPTGYHDPSDPFADECVLSLWADFEELTAEGNPYPIPKEDPRMRYLNGKVVE